MGCRRPRGRDAGWTFRARALVRRPRPRALPRHSGRGRSRRVRAGLEEARQLGLGRALPSRAHHVGSHRPSAHGAVATGAPSVRDMRAKVEAAGGTLVMLAAPDDFMREAGAWGPAPATIDIMRRIKKAFDPDGILNPGRFVV